MAVIRLSGQGAITLFCDACLKDNSIPLTPRVASVRSLLLKPIPGTSGTSDPLEDKALIIAFPDGNSFTGEEAIEVQCHGNPILVSIIINACTENGARPAQPGEFSLRAFQNGKMDLTQAEALADLINASTERAVIACTRSLHGNFGRDCLAFQDTLLALLAEAEAHIDFSDQDIDLVSRETLATRCDALANRLGDFLTSSHQGRHLSEGYHIAIAGKPNAGKSSLFNALVGDQAAIVADIPGTTRDVLKETLSLSGVPLTLYDTAGLRDSSDLVEIEGVRRAKELYQRIDRLCYVIRLDQGHKSPAALVADEGELQELLQQHPSLPFDIIFSCCDLSSTPPAVIDRHDQLDQLPERDGRAIILSSKMPETVASLRHHWQELLARKDGGSSEQSVRTRHLDCIRRCCYHLNRAGRWFEKSAESVVLACEELRFALQALGEIVGKTTNEDLLGKIFSSFCVGK